MEVVRGVDELREAILELRRAGHAIGFVFAAVVLCTTVIAFPLLLDRDVGAYEAIHASVRAVLVNPIPMAVWGLIVAALLIVG